MKSIIFFILLLCVGCSLSRKRTNHKTNIDSNSVDFVTLKKELRASDSIYFLTDKETKMFINEWNNSDSKGIYKMIPRYWIIVHFKNDSIRNFRINGKLIKENDDWTYSMSSSNLTPSLWEHAKAMPPPPKSSIFDNGCDSISRIAQKDYKKGIREYTVMGFVEATEFEIYYSNYMKRNYNIIMKANCAPTLLEECYAQSLNFEIEEEYGTDFIRLTREEAKNEFNNKQE